MIADFFSQYPYTLLTLFLLIFAFIFYLIRRDLWKSFWFAGIFSMFFGFFELAYSQDYWHPNLLLSNSLSIEDFIVCFAMGAIPAITYKVFLKLRDGKRVKKDYRRRYVLIGVIIFLVLWLGFNWVTAHAASIGLLIVGLTIWFQRKDLRAGILGGAISFTILYSLAFILTLQVVPDFVDSHWILEVLTGIRVFGVPIEEILWAFPFGMCLGVAYEYVFKKTITHFK